MRLADGVQVVERQHHQAGISAVLGLIARADVQVYVIDTNFRPDIHMTGQLMRAIMDSMEVPEWYGYSPEEVIAAHCRNSPTLIHLVVLVLRDGGSPPILQDPAFVAYLSAACRRAREMQRSFQTWVFTQPVALGHTHM